MPLFKKKKDKKKENVQEITVTVEEVEVVDGDTDEVNPEERGVDTEPQAPHESFEDVEMPESKPPVPPKPQFIQGSGPTSYTVQTTMTTTTTKGFTDPPEVYPGPGGYSQPEYPVTTQPSYPAEKAGYPAEKPGYQTAQSGGLPGYQEASQMGYTGPYGGVAETRRGPPQMAAGFDYLNWRPFGQKRKGLDTTSEYLLTAHALVPYVHCVVASAKEGSEEWRWKRLTQAPPPMETPSRPGGMTPSRLMEGQVHG